MKWQAGNARRVTGCHVSRETRINEHVRGRQYSLVPTSNEGPSFISGPNQSHPHLFVR